MTCAIPGCPHHVTQQEALSGVAPDQVTYERLDRDAVARYRMRHRAGSQAQRSSPSPAPDPYAAWLA